MDSKNVDGFKINMHNENGKCACHISFRCQYCIKMGNCEDVLKCNILQGYVMSQIQIQSKTIKIEK